MAVATSTAILVGSALAAGTTGYFGQKQLEQSRRQRNKQDDLEQQRKKELEGESRARETARAKAASAGSRVGARTSFTQALGFGSGTTQDGVGAGNLFGN